MLQKRHISAAIKGLNFAEPASFRVGPHYIHITKVPNGAHNLALGAIQYDIVPRSIYPWTTKAQFHYPNGNKHLTINGHRYLVSLGRSDKPTTEFIIKDTAPVYLIRADGPDDASFRHCFEKVAQALPEMYGSHPMDVGILTTTRRSVSEHAYSLADPIRRFHFAARSAPHSLTVGPPSHSSEGVDQGTARIIASCGFNRFVNGFRFLPSVDAEITNKVVSAIKSRDFTSTTYPAHEAHGEKYLLDLRHALLRRQERGLLCLCDKSRNPIHTIHLKQ